MHYSFFCCTVDVQYIEKSREFRPLCIKSAISHLVTLTTKCEIKDVDWSQRYPEAEEDLDPKFPKPLGKALSTAMYFDSNWTHETTRKSISGVVCFIGMIAHHL